MDPTSAVVEAFNRLGGDPTQAVNAARKFKTKRSWVAWQASQAAAVGAASIAVPGLHLPAMVLDMAALMHKLAYCSWGVGSLHDCQVEGKDDLAVILALWSGAADDSALTAAIESAGKNYNTLIGGYGAIAAGAAGKVASKAATKAAVINPNLAVQGTAMFARLVIKKAGYTLPTQGVAIGSFLMKKASPKIAPKLAAKVGAKAAAGWVPLIGPAIGASTNAYLLTHTADSADRYYTCKKKFETALQEQHY